MLEEEIQALQKYLIDKTAEDYENSFTKPTYMKVTGKGDKKANKDLDLLVQNGILRRGDIKIKDIFGRVTGTVGYTIVKNVEGAENDVQ